MSEQKRLRAYGKGVADALGIPLSAVPGAR